MFKKVLTKHNECDIISCIVLSFEFSFYHGDKMTDPVIDALKENSTKESGTPQTINLCRAESNQPKIENEDKFFEFVVLTISSVLASFVPIILSALFNNLSEDAFIKDIFGREEIIFTVITLALSVTFEVSFMEIKKGRVLKCMLPLLLVVTVWNMGAYIYLQQPNGGALGNTYRIPIIVITSLATLLFSGLLMFFANHTYTKQLKRDNK